MNGSGGFVINLGSSAMITFVVIVLLAIGAWFVFRK
jgi:hypothetical protein